MYISAALASTLLFAAVQACIECPHPGNFTGRLIKYTTSKTAYCGLEDAPPNATYASISAKYYNPPDESPCLAPINVTNPVTNVTISAVVVGQCKTCTEDTVYLTENGYAELSTRKRKPFTTVEWTFA